MLPPEKIETLLNELCQKWGFCLPAEQRSRISQIAALEPYDFAAQVLKAEGMNPEYEKTWMDRIASYCTERTGADP